MQDFRVLLALRQALLRQMKQKKETQLMNLNSSINIKIRDIMNLKVLLIK